MIHDARQPGIDRKPFGIWYAFNDGWFNHIASGMPEWVSDYRATFEIEIDLVRILVLSTRRELRAFARRYARPSLFQQGFEKHGLPPEDVFDWIAWHEVAERWSGIEFRPYAPDSDHLGDWYASLDIASGCVWDTRAIRSFRRAPPERELIHR